MGLGVALSTQKPGSGGYGSSLAWGPQGDFIPAECVSGASPGLFGFILSVLLKAFLALK